MTVMELRKTASDMQAFLEDESPLDTGQLVERLSMLNVLLARSGLLMVEAQRLADVKTGIIYREQFKDIKQLSPTVARSYVQGLLADETYISGWMERINRTCVHQSENLRTQISYAKEELRLTKTGY